MGRGVSIQYARSERDRHTPLDRVLAELAGRQHGRVALWQLAELGLRGSAVAGRVAAGRLHRVHRAVYAVGHVVETRESAWMGAVLACGPDAVLSHRSAAALWGLRPDARTSIDVTCPSRRGGRLPGIEAHCSRTLASTDVTTRRGVPCTSVARTLIDLAGVVDRRALERCIEEAERLRVFDGRAVREVLERSHGRRGAALLEEAIARYEEPLLTERELERRFIEACGALGVRRPRTQVPIELAPGDTAFVDFLWEEERLVVETDGHATHGTREAFERDRRRDRRLAVLGYRVIRFTWRDVVRRPHEVAETVARLLYRGRSPDSAATAPSPTYTPPCVRDILRR